MRRTYTARSRPLQKLKLILAGGLLLAGCGSVLGSDNEDFRDPPPIAPADEAAVPDSVRRAYREDAARLALRHLALRDSLASLPVIIPPALEQSLYDALLHVHASRSAARDSVVEIFRIHTFPRLALREILVGIDPGAGWTSAWRAGESLTGNPAADSLVVSFGLEVARVYSFSSGQYVLLRAARPVNTPALARRLAELEGVISADPNGAGGDGNDIRAELAKDGWFLDYSAAYGDCPAGCIHRHIWRFHADVRGTVRFIGSRGDPAPPVS